MIKSLLNYALMRNWVIMLQVPSNSLQPVAHLCGMLTNMLCTNLHAHIMKWF
jgi:hypothetical protein